MLWVKTYGSSSHEEAASVIQTGNGCFALAGYTDSYGAGQSDFWLVKTDSIGVVQWTQAYGGSRGYWADSSMILRFVSLINIENLSEIVWKKMSDTQQTSK